MKGTGEFGTFSQYQDIKVNDMPAERVDSKYGAFDFPIIPGNEDYTGPMSAIKQQSSSGFGVKPPLAGQFSAGSLAANKMLNMPDPNQTAKSIMSVNSVNLERINQRNNERLAKLEALELQEDLRSNKDRDNDTTIQEQNGLFTDIDQDLKRLI